MLTPHFRRKQEQEAFNRAKIFQRDVKSGKISSGKIIKRTVIPPGTNASSVQGNASASHSVYPAPVISGVALDSIYLNALVADVQNIKKSLSLLHDLSVQQSLMDKVIALQERIELLEDDIDGCK